ncbi:jg13467 [Pararge aegeria aegeria]|uniref:Jg13467 protein n=1 Tax=Pararge aegeria aegeria TaxID=348720 RepID=A0A8S4RLG9_9NEOP|nr:jg13467 [Pararge aegeria aegeria]
MQQVAYCFKIKQSFTALYHPQANPVERKNRDLKTQLAILVEGDQQNWCEQLPSIRFALNTAICTSTNCSPAYLTFGRELRTPHDNLEDFRQILITENFIPEITPKIKLLAQTMTKAKEVQEMKEETRKLYADRARRMAPEYKVGDLVLVNTHPISNAAKGFSAKFAPRRDGPYVILGQHGPSSYQLATKEEPDKKIGIHHSSALTLFHKPENSIELPQPVQPIRRRGRPRKEQTQILRAPRGRGKPE